MKLIARNVFPPHKARLPDLSLCWSSLCTVTKMRYAIVLKACSALKTETVNLSRSYRILGWLSLLRKPQKENKKVS